MEVSMTSPYFHLSPYIPRLFWDSWLSESSKSTPSPDKRQRLHVYNVHENELTELQERPEWRAPLFQGFHLEETGHGQDPRTSKLLQHAEEVYRYLEDDVARYVDDILGQLNGDEQPEQSHLPSSSPSPASADSSPSPPSSISISLNRLSKLKRLLIFIRFRNSDGYASIVRKLYGDLELRKEDGNIYPAYKLIIVQVQRRYILRAFVDFLNGNDRRECRRTHECLDIMYGACAKDGTGRLDEGRDRGSHANTEERQFVDFFHEIMDSYCWRMVDAELCIGVVKEERETGKEEYILPEVCYGSLDEGFEEDPESCDFFFPINPSVSFYLLGTSLTTPPPPLMNQHTLVTIPVGLEGMIDVHLRNSMVLQTYPTHLIFASLKCIVCSLKSYDEFRWINEHQDYSRLRMRCRQKYSKEELLKTLVLRDRTEASGASDSEDDSDDEGARSGRRRETEEKDAALCRSRRVRVFDLTDEVRLEGEWAVGFGTFSDVYQGTWKDPMERRERVVAVKFLRSVMVKNVKERLIRRIQAEVSTWHQLCHRNVSQFFGIVQKASTFGMVSPWYSNGIIPDYLKTHPTANRLKLLTQIASGVQHLHSHIPPIVHGDLKGGNILIDAHGYAIITDFGLSKVLEEVSQVCGGGENTPPGTACGGRGTSIFAGSTRWMAPELIMALVHDTGEGGGPSISTMSDVYAFGSVCLEVATDDLPYPHRPNDHAVIMDIMIGTPPKRAGSVCKVQVRSEDEFWGLLERCWGVPAERRPSMTECLGMLEGMGPGVEARGGPHRRRSS